MSPYSHYTTTHQNPWVQASFSREIQQSKGIPLSGVPNVLPNISEYRLCIISFRSKNISHRHKKTYENLRIQILPKKLGKRRKRNIFCL